MSTKSKDQKVNKNSQDADEQKTSLFKMKDLLQSKKEKKNLKGDKESAQNNSEDELTTSSEVSPDEKEQFEQQLAKLPAIEVQKKMRERPSFIASAKWYQKLFFSWVFNVIEYSQDHQLKMEDLGGLRDEDLLQGKLQQVEEIFDGQKEKNIFLAVVKAFKDRYIFSMFGIGVHLVMHMSYPMIIAEIIRFMQDTQETNFTYGVNLIALLVVLNICMMLLDCHTWYNNLTTGCMAQKIITAMTIKKQLKLNAATSKNYESGQIHSVRGATHRLVHFCWELSHFVTTPIWICYCSIRLFQKIGFTFVFGLSLFVFCYYFDRYFHRELQEEHHEQHKINEKRMNLTSESFENIKTIKFYGWDEYFKKKILEYRAKEIENGQRISNIYLILSFVWNFLPRLMSSLSFVIYLAFGNNFELAEVMEMLMLFSWIQGALHHLLNMRQQIADLRICIRRIQDYLAQDEVDINQIVSSTEKASKTSEYAIKINHQNFSWGLQTQDVDEMFDKMHKELKGITDERKSKEQLREELENKQKKEAELKKQRKLDNVVCLKDIDIKIKKGQFVCIIGKIGSGKSSLLSALIGDLLPVPSQIIDSYKGENGWEHELNQQEAESFQSELIHNQNKKQKESAIEVNGTIAYTQQTPWIRNKIVRENIVYNQPFDYEKYVDTIQYCELESDINMLKAGDQTEIGEKGVNLSGGQKARLGLARAVYADREIYLMDDPISALDAHVRKQIIKNVYFGVLKDRTRVLVTHAIDFLNQADHIIMMDGGRIKAQGTYEELEKIKEFSDLMDLNEINKDMKTKKDKTKSKMKSTMSSGMERQKSTFEEVQMNNQVDAAETQNPKEDEDSDSPLDDDYNPENPTKAAESSEENESDAAADTLELKKKKTMVYPSKLSLDEKKKKLLEYGTIKDKEEGRIIDDERDEQASISNKTITRLMSYYGHWSQFGMLVVAKILMVSAQAYRDYMIGQWAEDKELQNNSSKFWGHTQLIVIIVFGQAMFQIFQDWMMRVLINKTLAKVHNDVLQSIMNAPVNTFFDVTPNGMIMNRFSDDMNQIEHIIHCFMHCCHIGIEIVYMFILICTQNHWAILVVPALAGYAKYIWNFTNKAKRQAIQLLQKQNTPIHTHQGEIMEGTSTIRAFNTEDHAVDADAENQNTHLLAQQITYATFTWYSTRLMFASCASTMLSGLLCLYKKQQGVDTIMIAMAFQQVVHLGYRVNGLIHISGDFEKKLSSVQKCFRLLEIPHENKEQPKHTETAWPSKGTITFKDVELKYRPTTEMVLRKLNVSFTGGEKIGVVGRTGAGKSTITLALTRIIEICGGNIEIDGVDINKINLQQVREAITIIPQEPTLFKGTLRFNLDPEDKCTDEEILELLKKAELYDLILKKKKEEDEKKKKLDSELSADQLAKVMKDRQIENDSLLNYHIQPKGENLSSGEKSLVCICRAILRKNKIVILDEATANIDIVTEQTIQKLIKESFQDCTMIVVAHRLQTIIESDKVLVLDKGQVAEFDTPDVLRNRPESHFAHLINEIQMEENKRKEAKKEDKKEEESESK